MRIFQKVSTFATLGVAVAMLAGCGGSEKKAESKPENKTVSSAIADRSTADKTTRGLMEMLQAKPHPGVDDVLPFVSTRNDGKNKVREWMTAHPKIEVSLTKFTLEKPVEGNEGKASVTFSVVGKACSAPGVCADYPTQSGRMLVVTENGEKVISYPIILNLLGSKAKK